jgi:hypothetical protein
MMGGHRDVEVYHHPDGHLGHHQDRCGQYHPPKAAQAAALPVWLRWNAVISREHS